ncbi:hypothetical protein OS493_005644 [Desmophyllum pertusum]|uniref:Uncharacterized protein n=1 Tax=Desmophyllum pertusum TaxID=174260 RepID=A0A9X0CM09_9CNID|nr:hypothetical protein OS493_005644 [Desmophyllum pertusum]
MKRENTELPMHIKRKKAYIPFQETKKLKKSEQTPATSSQSAVGSEVDLYGNNITEQRKKLMGPSWIHVVCVTDASEEVESSVCDPFPRPVDCPKPHKEST